MLAHTKRSSHISIKMMKSLCNVKYLQTILFVKQPSTNHRVAVMWQWRKPSHFRPTFLRRVGLIHRSYIKPRIEYIANNLTWSILFITLRFITGSWDSAVLTVMYNSTQWLCHHYIKQNMLGVICLLPCMFEINMPILCAFPFIWEILTKT